MRLQTTTRVNEEEEKEKEGKYTQLAQLLHQMSGDEAVDFLQGFAARRKAGAAASGGLPRQIPEYDVVRNMFPPKQSVEFELTVRHPVAYPTLFPLQVAALSLEGVLGTHSVNRPRCVDL